MSGPDEEGSIVLLDGRTLAWSSRGPADAPPVVWLHGSTGSGRSMPALSGVRLLGYDRPGYGGSTHHPRRDLRTDVADVRELLSALHLDCVTVLAFSGGAATAYALAALAPDLVRSLWVMSGAAWPTDAPPPDEVLIAAAAELEADPQAAVAGLAQDAPPDDVRALSEVSAELLCGARDAVRAGTAGWIHEARLIRTTWPFAPADVCAEVTMWHGRLDPAVALEQAELTARALPAARVHVLDDAGHLGWLAHLPPLASKLRAEQ